MPFKLTNTEIPDVKVIEPIAFPDERGYFLESFKESDFSGMGIKRYFRQDNHSFSVAGTLRGLHFQKPPYSQGKLMRVVHGKIIDVAVDVRAGSPTYGKYVSRELSSENHLILWVPEGFAHGFLALTDAVVLYKATSEYNKNSEGGLIWNDPDVGVEWPFDKPVISEKDTKWPGLKEIKNVFEYGDRQ
ncbi:dTDP-4-dehydrorhamnose 3,5-epimerase [Thermoplasmatales archaeon]|nr:dTDP-4-dehydrorhamnose 3,5-epimerase [Thermoplasmatales archaeon]